MATFGFWNVNSLRNVKAAQKEIPRLVAELALERSLEVLFLIECEMPYASLMAGFKGGPAYYPIECRDRFKVLARFDPKLMERLSPPAGGDRFDMWHLKLPLQRDVILTLVHGPDKRNNSPLRQELFLEQVTSTISFFEKEIGHDRSVVFGDFNANPFELPMAGVRGMNAVMSRTTALGKPRRMYDQSYSYFYNPMWNLYGDEPRNSAPATYYYLGSDPHELYWHMLDQVLIRPSLISEFDFSVLEIVTSILGTELTRPNGIPNETKFSDHLPVVFAVDLSD
jgi:hypothetical protein